MLKILVFEDLDLRIQWFKRELVGNSVDFFVKASDVLEALKTIEYDLIFLDHDVTMEHYGNPEKYFEDSGSGVARFLYYNKNSLKSKIIVHSCNPHGSARMMNFLKGRKAQHVPFPKLKEKGLDWLLDGTTT